MYVCMYVCMYYICLCIYTYMYIYIYMCMYVCMYVYIYIYIYINIDTVMFHARPPFRGMGGLPGGPGMGVKLLYTDSSKYKQLKPFKL